MRRAALLVLALSLAGCGTSSDAINAPNGVIAKARPQVIEPTAGVQPVVAAPPSPVGDPNAHATPSRKSSAS